MAHITDTFVTLSADSPRTQAEPPPLRGGKRTKARIEFEMLTDAPYRLTLDELGYAVYAAQRAEAGEPADPAAQWLAKGRPCMRASPLVKSWGWGAHYDARGHIALVPGGSADYARLAAGQGVGKVEPGMRNKRA